MKHAYDVIVVGARCAGSPTAMQLARRGRNVLLVDRATFPSDTVSTHVVHPLAAAALERWGLLARLVATGCPPIHTYSYDFGQFTIEGTPGTREAPVAYCPRRTVLDRILVEAAVEAGVELREGFSVEKITMEGDRVVGIEGRDASGDHVTERAEIVVGADGRFSRVADAVEAESYRERGPILAPYYAYYSGLPMNGRFETYIRPDRGFAAAQTHDGLTLVIAGWPFAEFDANRHDVELHFDEVLALAPEFDARIRSAKRESRFAGLPVANYFRKPYGPGWALVGDAGYNKDPITAQGIYDAFIDSERCVDAIDDSLLGVHSYEEAMSHYQHERDEHALPMFEFTCQLAALEPPPPEMQALFAAIAAGGQDGKNEFVRMNAGTISPGAFFAPENVSRLMSQVDRATVPMRAGRTR